RLVLRDRALDEWAGSARGRSDALGTAVPPILPQPRRQAREGAPLDARLGQLVEGILEEFCGVARERVGHDALALDDASVAERGLLAWATAVDKHDGPAARLQVQGEGDADDAGSKNENVSAHGLGHFNRLRSLSDS